MADGASSLTAESLPPMRMVSICTLVRNGMPYLAYFRRQIESLMVDETTRWHLYCLEGDSSDGSWAFLQAWAHDDHRVTIGRLDVGGATNKAALARNWARAGNACLDLIPADSQHTHVLWLESDLCVPPEILRRLLRHDVDVVAPVIFLGGLFYDTWGFCGIDGKHWQNDPPFHPHYRGHALIPMQSVGSCVLFSRRVLDGGLRMRGTYDDGLLVGLCKDARAAGMTVWADTGTAILHPVDLWAKQLWRIGSVTMRTAEGAALPDMVGSDVGDRTGGMPALDPDAMFHAHVHHWRRVLAAVRTNRLRVDIEARPGPRREYDLRITSLEPSGLWAHPIGRRVAPLLQRLVARAVRRWAPVRWSDTPQRPTLSAHCAIRIHLNDAV
jgi:hypothetical protein